LGKLVRHGFAAFRNWKSPRGMPVMGRQLAESLAMWAQREVLPLNVGYILGVT